MPTRSAFPVEHARQRTLGSIQWLKCILQRKCGIFTRNRGGLIGDKWPSTVASRPTISLASARKGICGRSPRRAGHKIVAVFKETASGADNVRPERAKDPGVARAHEIDAILVTELSRSTQDLVQPIDDLHGWRVSVLAQTGLSFAPSTASG